MTTSTRDGRMAEGFMTRPLETDHALRNQLSIILGYARLLLDECPPDDPHRADIEEIVAAANAAVEMLAAVPDDPP